MQYLASARINTTEPALFHVGCSTQHLHLAMGGPAYHHVKRAHGLITSPWKEPRFGEHQASYLKYSNFILAIYNIESHKG